MSAPLEFAARLLARRGALVETNAGAVEAVLSRELGAELGLGEHPGPPTHHVGMGTPWSSAWWPPPWARCRSSQRKRRSLPPGKVRRSLRKSARLPQRGLLGGRPARCPRASAACPQRICRARMHFGDEARPALRAWPKTPGFHLCAALVRPKSWKRSGSRHAIAGGALIRGKRGQHTPSSWGARRPLGGERPVERAVRPTGGWAAGAGCSRPCRPW